MKQFSIGTLALLFVDIALLFFCLSNFPSILDRPSAPFIVVGREGRMVVSRLTTPNAAGGLEKGDAILGMNALPLAAPEMVEVVSDMSVIGQRVRVDARRGQTDVSTSVDLVPFYDSPRFSVIAVFVGFISWCVGIFVLLKRPRDLSGRVLHWTLVLGAALALLTQAKVEPGNLLSEARRAALFIVYPLAGASFLYFATLYPRRQFGSDLLKGVALYAPALLLGGFLAFSILDFIHNPSPGHFDRFLAWYDVLHAGFFVCSAVGIGLLYRSHRRSETHDERRMIAWIFWGFAIGAGPFLVFFVLPQMLGIVIQYPEEYATIFFLAVPWAFALSFLKFKTLDIEVETNRTIVYALLTLTLGATTALAVLILASIFLGERVFGESLAAILVAVALVYALGPVRVRARGFVEGILFPVKTDFPHIVQSMTERLHHELTLEKMFARFFDEMTKVVPISSGAAYLCEGNVLLPKSRYGGAEVSSVLVSKEDHRQLVRQPVLALATVLDSRLSISEDSRGLLARLRAPLCIALQSESHELLGAMAFAPTKAGMKFRVEEIELMSTVCEHMAEIVERLAAQEKMVLEGEARRRTEEISKLKSFFVSSVSHDLRTPLTSIRLFAETLRTSHALSSRRKGEYLRIIEGESERLTRLIDNVLDFARIERGEKTYTFDEVRLDKLVHHVKSTFAYQLKLEGGALHVRVGRHLPVLKADGDALHEAIANLISNGFKYSTGRKVVHFSVLRLGGNIVVEVRDRGIGIPRDEIPKLFSQFYRVRDKRGPAVSGTGLGLAVVKHIVDAHGGRVEVKSAVGRGSSFRLILPLDRNSPGAQV